MSMSFKRTLIVAATSIGLGAAASGASAGYLSDFSGWVEMSDCPVCDATVSFAVWENTDGNWFDDLDYNRVDGDGTTTGAENYVYMYQVVNTDHDPSVGADEDILDFVVADLLYKGNDVFTGMGWFSGYVFNDPTEPGPVGQTGGAAYAGGVNLGATPGSYVDDTAPDQFPPGVVRNNNPESDSDPETGDAGTAQSGDVNVTPNGLVQAASVDPIATNISELITLVDHVDHVAHWQFSTGTPGSPLAPGETSSVLWAVSDFAPMFYWGSAETSGGPGASGDVPVPEGVPVPATFLLFGAGLGLMGLSRLRKV